MAKVLRKAAELQAGAKPPKSEHGSSESELRAAAREIGLDPQFVDQALAELDSEPAAASQSFFGGPMRAEFDQTFDGVLDDNAWEDTVADLRKTFGEDGTVEVRGSVREWIGTGGGSLPLSFSARQVDGQVRITAMSRHEGLAAICYIIAFLPFLILTAFLIRGLGLGGPIAVGAALSVAMVVFMLTRAIFSSGARQTEVKLRKAVSRFGQRLAPAPLLSGAADPQAESAEDELTEQA